MRHVLRHYLPIRKSILILSETILLSLVVTTFLAAHLEREDRLVGQILAQQGLDREQAFLRVVVSSVLVAILCQVAIAFNELYDVRISSSRWDRAKRFLGSAGAGTALALACVVLAELWEFERVLDFPGLALVQRVVLLTFALVLGFTVLYFWRHLFHELLRRFRFADRVLVIGTGETARSLAREMVLHPESGLEVVGLLHTSRESAAERRGAARVGAPRGARSQATLRAVGAGTRASAAPAGETGARVADGGAERAARPRHRLIPPGEAADLGGDPEAGEPHDQRLYELVQELEVDTVVIALEERRGQLPTEELLACRLAGVVIEEVESTYERLTGKISVRALRPSYLIFNPGFVQHPFAESAKRAVDVVLALAVFALTWPLMLATAIAVRLDSPGPSLFRQERTGRYGRAFTLLKFRSMRQDAEAASGPVWAQENDPRITRVGRFLRKARIDELPQIFNVIAGDMSFVGPRPERPHFVAELAREIPYYDQRHTLKPGLTGWAQINYPYGSSVEDALQKLQYELFYIKHQSVLFDLSILFNTIKTVVLRRGT